MKYIDAEKLIATLERQNVDKKVIEPLIRIIDSLTQEQPMPDSTKLIELWHEDKEKLKEKDFRNDPWRLAYNAFLCGFGRGIAVNKQEQPEVDLEDEIDRVIADYSFTKTIDSSGLKTTVLDYEKIAHHFAEWGEKNAYKAIMKKADEVRDKRFDIDYEVKIDPAAGFDFDCVNVYHEGKLVGQYVEPKEEKKLPEGVEEAAKKFVGYDMDCDELRDYEIGIATFKAGAEWQKKSIISLIESRLSEIIGDAQPKPALRAELQELIDKIKES